MQLLKLFQKYLVITEEFHQLFSPWSLEDFFSQPWKKNLFGPFHQSAEYLSRILGISQLKPEIREDLWKFRVGL